jgi:hypothetical protein
LIVLKYGRQENQPGLQKNLYPIATGKLVNTGRKYIFGFGLNVFKACVINK